MFYDIITQYTIWFMAAKRHKTKTVVMTLRIDPQVKAAAEIAAERDHRSLTNFVEVLILKHCNDLNIQPPIPAPEDTSR
jgi:hypothetical protein